METLEFIIYPDGRVKETVTGIVGSSCQEITAAIENKLGVVVDRKPTSEQYAQRTVKENNLSSQSNFLGW